MMMVGDSSPRVERVGPGAGGAHTVAEVHTMQYCYSSLLEIKIKIVYNKYTKA